MFLSGDNLERGDSRTTTIVAVADDTLEGACCVDVVAGVFVCVT